MSRRKTGRARGFTLVETMVAITILAFGMLGVAALMSQMSGNSTESRYMSEEALLASEKLEYLSQLPSDDPGIAASSGTAGSLTSDTSQSVTSGGVTQNVDYFDQVQTSAGNGSIIETTTAPNGSGGTQYTTITHAPDGSVTSVTSATAPSNPDMVTFKRRWVIEQDVPVTGVRRITVLVTLQSAVAGQSATFQTSMVRP
jgi:prepilin-type N-terminal cleavage/methylation domain-containing protein